jgi:predicted nucleotidyltransferase component of viral defense system
LGANHSKNQRPLPPHRWHSKIKLEVSTDEKVFLPGVCLDIIHPYSDFLSGAKQVQCYTIDEIVAEKLRALKQRSYTAPRDFYDLFHLTKDFTKEDWQSIVPIFKQKMADKNLTYKSPEDIIDDTKIANAIRAWRSSIAHQINTNMMPESSEIIESVVQRVKKYMPK